MLVRFGAEWWAEPSEHPANGATEPYDVDAEALDRWRDAQREYSFGEWVQRDDGHWALRIPRNPT
jgi:hypothetical protein